MQVSIRPLADYEFSQASKWAEAKEFSEFFRRLPPRQDWRGPEALAGFYAVLLEDSLVGLAVIGNYDFFAKSSEVGVLITCPDSEQRKVVAGDVLRQLCDYIFDYLGNNKVVARILSHRTKLAERMTRLGFRQEGLLRASCQGKDELLLAVLKSEYDRTGKG